MFWVYFEVFKNCVDYCVWFIVDYCKNSFGFFMGVYLYFVFFYLDMEVNWFKFDGFILCFYNFIGRFEVLFGFFFFFFED